MKEWDLRKIIIIGRNTREILDSDGTGDGLVPFGPLLRVVHTCGGYPKAERNDEVDVLYHEADGDFQRSTL